MFNSIKAVLSVGVAFTALIVACEKETFPEKNMLIGEWVEKTNDSFKHRFIFKEQTCYFFKPTSKDTLSYRLDDENECLYLSLKNSSSAGESSHKIAINKKDNLLTIWGIMPSTPEGGSEVTFKKVKR